MSTMTAHIFGYPQADRVIVPAPNEPMSVAREVIRALYTDALGVVLRDHRGDLHRWTGMSWPELELRDVRSAVYQFLERSQYVHRARQARRGTWRFAGCGSASGLRGRWHSQGQNLIDVASSDESNSTAGQS